MNSIEIKLLGGAYIKSFADVITYHKSATDTFQLGYCMIDGIHVLDGTVQRVGPVARLNKDFAVADPVAVVREVVDCLRSHQIKAKMVQT